MTQVVHQLVPSVVPGDATTGHTLQMKKLLEQLGYHSEIYALAVHPALEHQVRLIGELSGPSRPDAFVLYQFSAYSELADHLIGRREQIALNYHNITPHRFFLGYDPGLALSLRAAEVQVVQLARLCGLAICDSQFNADDLHARNFGATTVAPILLDLADFDAEPDPVTARTLEERRAAGDAQFLCVGGVAPHKAQHDLVKALAVYRRVYDPRARLVLVGRTMSPGYGTALRGLVASLGLGEAVDLAGGVSHGKLVAYYRGCDALVSVSEHEGFCVPLLEAMHHGLPVAAYAAGAVAATLGGGGLLLEDKSPGTLAAAMWRIASDPAMVARLARAGSARVAQFSLTRTRATMTAAVRQWIAAEGSTVPSTTVPSTSGS